MDYHNFAILLMLFCQTSFAQNACGTDLVSELNNYCSATLNRTLAEEIAQTKVYQSVQNLIMAGEISCYMGMKSGKIPDNAITASTSWSNPGHAPYRARLDGKPSSGNGACWAPSRDSNPWIQVDLGTVQPVAGVITQGRDSPTYIQWMTHFNIAYGNDENHLKTITEEGENKLFVGNDDQTSYAYNWFSPPLLTRYVRIYPKNQDHGRCMRFEVIGGDCFKM